MENRQQSQLKEILPAIIGFVVLILIILGVFLAYRALRSQTNQEAQNEMQDARIDGQGQPPSQQEQQQTAGSDSSQTYEDTQYGFNVDYTNSWERGNTGYFSLQKEGALFLITEPKIAENEQSSVDYATQRNSPVESYDILPLGAVTWVVVENCGQNCTKAFYAKENDLLYELKAFVPSNISSTTKKELERIISGFQFTNPSSQLDIGDEGNGFL